MRRHVSVRTVWQSRLIKRHRRHKCLQVVSVFAWATNSFWTRIRSALTACWSPTLHLPVTWRTWGTPVLKFSWTWRLAAQIETCFLMPNTWLMTRGPFSSQMPSWHLWRKSGIPSNKLLKKARGKAAKGCTLVLCALLDPSTRGGSSWNIFNLIIHPNSSLFALERSKSKSFFRCMMQTVPGDACNLRTCNAAQNTCGKMCVHRFLTRTTKWTVAPGSYSQHPHLRQCRGLGRNHPNAPGSQRLLWQKLCRHVLPGAGAAPCQCEKQVEKNALEMLGVWQRIGKFVSNAHPTLVARCGEHFLSSSVVSSLLATLQLAFHNACEYTCISFDATLKVAMLQGKQTGEKWSLLWRRWGTEKSFDSTRSNRGGACYPTHQRGRCSRGSRLSWAPPSVFDAMWAHFGGQLRRPQKPTQTIPKRSPSNVEA